MHVLTLNFIENYTLQIAFPTVFFFAHVYHYVPPVHVLRDTVNVLIKPITRSINEIESMKLAKIFQRSAKCLQRNNKLRVFSTSRETIAKSTTKIQVCSFSAEETNRKRYDKRSYVHTIDSQ